MKRLLIVRHAKALKGGSRGGDFERELAPRGEDDAAEMGRRLTRREGRTDAIVSSPAQRALDTAKLFARELDFPWNQIRTLKPAYLADAGVLLDLVRGFDEPAQSVLLVGHNPGVSELARNLAAGFELSLPTAAVVAVDLPSDTWACVRAGNGSLRWYDYPKNRP